MSQLHAVLALEDGTVVRGLGFGAEKEKAAELVFNTSMSGYEEALTDPSYKGQVLMMTYPLIGNYGVREQIFESDKIQVEGFVVREMCEVPSHHMSKMTLDEFLKKYDIPGISDVDTRFQHHYFQYMIDYLEDHPKIGVVAGQIAGFADRTFPMFTGKVVRSEVVKPIDRYWDISIDSFLNVKAITLGFDLAILSNMEVDSPPSHLQSKKGRYRSGRLWVRLRR